MSKPFIILCLCFIILTSCKHDSDKNSLEDHSHYNTHDTLNKNLAILKLGIYDPSTKTDFNSRDYEFFDIISFVGYEINPKTGEAIDTQDWETSTIIDSIQTRGMNLLLQATSKGLIRNHEFLNNSRASATFTVEVSSKVNIQNATGVHLHFDAVALADRERLSTFVVVLGKHLHLQGYRLFLSLPNTVANAFDITAMNPYVDAFVLMPLPDVNAQEALKTFYLKQGVPKEKLLFVKSF